jgi:SpoVK/Ycf46/Vps4 family AAA+-type ATPase
MAESPTVRALRQALAVSPENLPLRLHLAATLRQEGDLDAAVVEYKSAVQQAPTALEPKLGLVETYFGQGRHSIAQVILEDVLAMPEAPAAAWLLQAQLAAAQRQTEEAVKALRRAIELQPELRRHELARTLGLDAEETAATVRDGRVAARPGDEDTAIEFHDEADRDLHDRLMLEKPEITFAQVGGMERVKDEIRMKIIHPLTHRDLFAAYGKKVGGGVLLYGPPGCGKTFLARATAGEVKADFMAVGLNDVLDMWLGQSEQKLHQIFETARRHPPCVLFFDEVDALGASRADMRHSAGRHLINQFLSELDGLQGKNEGLLVLAATNAPWHLDNAFRRPGRFDRILFVPPPDEAARRDILALLVKGKPSADLDLPKVAEKTDKYSGADLKALIDVAVEGKLAEALRTGRPEPLRTADLLKAAKTVRPSTQEWFVTARNYALYANEGGLYDDILDYLKIKR